MNNAPIGIFDSGLGGLTVARAIMAKLPNEKIVYLGDTAHTPFGPRPLVEVREFAIAGLDALVERGVKMLVIACNTATVAAIDDARQRYWVEQGIPVVEVISPTTREALARTRSGRIGVLGTIGTIESGVYPHALLADPSVHVVSQACPRFVEFVEKGVTSGDELDRVATEYLTPVKNENVDTVILGCTHYPFLSDVISKVLGSGVQLVSSSEGTACVVAETLTKLDMHHAPVVTNQADQPNRAAVADTQRQIRIFATNGSPQFSILARQLLGDLVDSVDTIHTN